MEGRGGGGRGGRRRRWTNEKIANRPTSGDPNGGEATRDFIGSGSGETGGAGGIQEGTRRMRDSVLLTTRRRLRYGYVYVSLLFNNEYEYSNLFLAPLSRTHI